MLCFRNLSFNALLPSLYLVEKSVHHNVALIITAELAARAAQHHTYTIW